MSAEPVNFAVFEHEARRRRYRRDPVAWVHEVLHEHVWSKQQDILRSVRDNRRTAVPSCHEAGKSFIAARAVAWWLSVHPVGEAFVVTTATTGAQVEAILWKEINRTHSKGQLAGRTNKTEWYMTTAEGNEELVAFGRKPSDRNPTAFQGIHAKFVLVVMDEACGIPGGTSDNPNSLWESADSLIANEFSRILAIGNPDIPDSEFAEVCKPGSGWHVIHIDAFDTPNFTDEEVPAALRPKLISKTWQEEKLRKWGENNPLYISKVRGRFPTSSKDGLIPVAWVMKAQTQTLEPSDPIELGIDVGGGGDKNIAALRRGPVVRIIRRDQEPNTMISCGNMIADIRSTGARVAKVDEIGVGRGLTERGKELGHPVVGVNVGKEPRDKEQFANVRAEGYWGLRERFQEGQIDIDADDDDLAAQLVGIKFKRSSSGKILIESKDEMKKRGMSSPDEADAVMLAYLPHELYGPQPAHEVEIMLG